MAALKRQFTWPGISKEVKKWCSSCPECQKAGKKPCHRVPSLPVISFSFTRLAFDQVGPLPKAMSEELIRPHLHVPETNYPEAIPLKLVDVLTAAAVWLRYFPVLGSQQNSLLTRDLYSWGK